MGKGDMTIKLLRSAFGAEAMARARYSLWSEHADQAGMANIARLLYAAAYAEQVLAGNYFRELGGKVEGVVVAANAVFGYGTVAENLQGAIDDEGYEVERLSQAHLETSRLQNKGGAERSLRYGVAAKKAYMGLLKAALEAARRDADMQLGDVYVCTICGYASEGVSVERCPICNAPRDRFALFPAH